MSDSKRRASPVWHLVAAAFISVIVLIAFYVIGLRHFNNLQWADFGSFVGGGAGVILTALTFLALLYTVHIQSAELFLSREELRLTREEIVQNRAELARSAQALNEQVSAINIQNFERTLFDSLRFLNDVVSELEHRNPAEDHARRGVQAFSAMYHRLVTQTQLAAMATNDGDEIGKEPTLITFFDQLRPMLGSYFRTLYNIYRYLDESDYKNREYYNRIIRSQIPDYALIILFYNSLTERGLKFQKYIIDFKILDNMNFGYLPNGSHAEILERLPTVSAQSKMGFS